MSKPKGGRGCKAPYNTHQVRVPEPVIPQVHSLIERYQDYLTDGGEPKLPPKFLAQDNKLVDKFIADLKLELERAKKEVNQLQSECKRLKRRTAEANKTLTSALSLKANAGGAIKKEIEKVLPLLS